MIEDICFSAEKFTISFIVNEPTISDKLVRGYAELPLYFYPIVTGIV